MSDICDDSEGVRRLSEGGARFKGAFAKRPAGETDRKPCCRCGSQPRFRQLDGGEILSCSVCGQMTPLLKSRQALQTIWNGMN